MSKQLFDDSILSGANASFIEAVYEDYLHNPNSVASAWREYFDQLAKQPDTAANKHPQGVVSSTSVTTAATYSGSESQTTLPDVMAADSDDRQQVAVLQLINMYRYLGLNQAKLDPLGLKQQTDVPELDPAYFGFTEADRDKVFNTGSLVGPEHATLHEILQILRETYCGSVGAEYMYISSVEQKRWIQARLEGQRSNPDYSDEYKRHILERLNAAEGLEKYLHTRYVGQKRFSGEGNESLIPLLDCLIHRAGKTGIQQIVMGMAHRARLNVLVNTLGKMPADLFREFEEKQPQELPSGDVKYHQGFSSAIKTSDGIVRLALAFNPSHLEIVNPVVEGSVRARQHLLNDKLGDKVLPVLIHGDAAYAGQGVVMETLNLSQTRGYGTGGTVHIIINNQIGFTTSDPRDSRSTLYCTDVSKMIEAPIFHVNGDDPEAVIMVAELAFDFRMRFHKDVVIDMVCFRRLGHNEQDEPMVTQPRMYQIISKHPGTRKRYVDKLVAEGVIKPEDADDLVQSYRNAMDEGVNPNKAVCYDYKSPYTINWEPFLKPFKWNEKVKTGVAIETLKQLAVRLTDIPEGFRLQQRVEKIIADRRLMGSGELPLDWGMAENLAYAALLQEGYPVRLSGQDSGRGTFFHRHAVLHDQVTADQDERVYVPLRHIQPEQPDFVVIDSMLSEEAVLGFEYGYATTQPNELVIWEAQFGDFANGAQVVIDQFIASGEAKWGRVCGLVMMLPHGYEGQGPEHSSARLERYLQLCANYNIQVCVPSTPAQMFHMLRRQMIRPLRKPLIIMSPKSMLRHKESVSSLEDLANGHFYPVIPETESLDSKKVRRIIACSGKIYYELMAYRKEQQITDMAIIRLEQLYPFPHEEFQAEIDRFSNAKSVIWCQEEPGNQGAWHRIQHYLRRHLRPEQMLGYALRESSASPAVGYTARHKFTQNELIVAAFRDKI
ncbi:MAG: 2-oxoglutarate dehydrogenase E1 component [Nitrosomonas sp.]|uniref:2-oxoglutarate dehydrogenase E1 component n=1 Tax=Nitrosomonas sp. TaxID=42353 RepID=UPI0027341E84|nr:2-oxoglutarate dehydrogenase E1 component [Nitrosomonas sp.]MDP1935115.1 2-oxoglutarate dehydrogenase E1 component [Nitrosomonas sp.]MDP3281124.1 2-oxoglutarate dehydrogenase E1 component [Nitrosomonas sp.]MDP3664323.1 2-oxoglutarate dehydrogenase E1 component [Nitrosomonas sp.]MDZ4105798.1 2-oxoglutarate dehydrogenase E1 component [Nitrosomonas sp.]